MPEFFFFFCSFLSSFNLVFIVSSIHCWHTVEARNELIRFKWKLENLLSRKENEMFEVNET